MDEEDRKVWAWGKWAQLETLLHEQVHLWQENFGEHQHKPGRVGHDTEFVEKCESLGLHPLPIIGCHMAVADGVFAQLMGELGIERPNDVPRSNEPPKVDWFRPEKDKGRSTLKKWVCPECGLKVRMGIAGDPKLRHHTCETTAGHPVFLIPGDVYIAKHE
jgi:hypothetical protein